MQTVWKDPTPLMDFIAGIATSLIVYLLATLIINKLKNRKNELQKKSKKSFLSPPNWKDSQKPKLFRFTRGNKALTSQQQEQLFQINKENLNKLRQLWKNEHL